MIFYLVTLTLQVDLLSKQKGLLIVAIYIWLPPASYVVFLTTLVDHSCISAAILKSHSFFVLLVYLNHQGSLTINKSYIYLCKLFVSPLYS